MIMLRCQCDNTSCGILKFTSVMRFDATQLIESNFHGRLVSY